MLLEAVQLAPQIITKCVQAPRVSKSVKNMTTMLVAKLSFTMILNETHIEFKHLWYSMWYIVGNWKLQNCHIIL